MIIGIDEVGRGCWAGPVVAGAVALPDGFNMPDNAVWRLADSKQLTRRQRQAADEALRRLHVQYGLGWVPAEELDEIGMTAAVSLAMRRAYESLPDEDRAAAEQVVIDGSINYLAGTPNSIAVIKADGSVPAVSAASIMAKVARDAWMSEAAERFPGYGFERHAGYGTTQHMQALSVLGVCQLHRKSFKPVIARIKS